MGYILIIVIAIVAIWWVERKTFRWETIIEYLWKRIYERADLIADEFKPEKKDNEFGQTYVIEKYKKSISLMGNIINSILDFINYLNKEKDENAEEETFGYGRFDFDFILNSAKRDPEIFKRILKRK